MDGEEKCNNLGILRRFALNLLKKDKTRKKSMRVKRKLMVGVRSTFCKF